MLTNSRFHCRSNSKGLMNPREVAVRLKQRDVLLLASDKGPDLIDLHPLGRHIANNSVLVFDAGLPAAPMRH